MSTDRQAWNRQRRSNHWKFGNRGGSTIGLRPTIAPVSDGKIGRSRAVKLTWATYRSRLNSVLAVLDPYKASSAVRTLADMTDEEKAALEERYGAKIKA